MSLLDNSVETKLSPAQKDYNAAGDAATGSDNKIPNDFERFRMPNLKDFQDTFSNQSRSDSALNSMLPSLTILDKEQPFAQSDRQSQESSWGRGRTRDTTEEDAARAAEIINSRGNFGDQKEQKEIDAMYRRAAAQGPEAVERLTKTINDKLEQSSSPYRINTEYSTELNWYKHPRHGAVNVRTHKFAASVEDVGACRIGGAPQIKSEWVG